MNKQEEEKLRIRLKSYPGNTPEIIDQLIDYYEDRAVQKQQLLSMGHSNASAERFLDQQGWRRPPGWHSVFFHPDSMRIRTRYLLIVFIIIVLFIYW